MDALFKAIVDDDLPGVEKLLRIDAQLTSRLIKEAKLYDQVICHWIYVGDTALHLASAGYRVEIVRRLLEAGADPNAAQNHRHSGPLHYAANGSLNCPAWDPKRQVKTIGILLEAGAEINSQDKNGASPLHRAVRTRSAEAVKCLLKAGANPKLKNKPGSTAFHLAVQNTGRGGSGADVAIAAQKAIIEVFLAAGVSPTLKDDNDKSVRDWARTDWIRELLG